MTGLKNPIGDHLPLVHFFLILFHYLVNAGEEDEDSSEDDTDLEPQRVINHFSFPANFNNCFFNVRSEGICENILIRKVVYLPAAHLP